MVASHAPNATLDAPDAPNATLGASHAPNATLGRYPHAANPKQHTPQAAQQTAAGALKQRGTQPLPQPRYEASLRSGGACQGIFPALTSTPRPSAQSNFGVPHATQDDGNVARQGDEPPETATRRLTASETPPQ
ncbi:hypothetical protein CU254_10100 [Amycolatopsis sp. AA4]|nr:hypothetical protein CU254_10100 [Amycolatopsis sp. AA4]